MELFVKDKKEEPLAWAMRPQTLGEICGQEHILAKGNTLYNLIENDRVISVIFYGPPGVGKTALANIISRKTQSAFLEINAVTSGIKEIRGAVEKSKYGKTIVFIDEIHRFNKTQQDALLPHIERGQIVLIGASTENPFFALTPALSSRTTLFKFKPLSANSIVEILKRALVSDSGLKGKLMLSECAFNYIAYLAEGDGRRALNILELVFLRYKEGHDGKGLIAAKDVKEVLDDKTLYYDESTHYDVISAFIKSVRGSDPDSALYWLARMIESGEAPLFIARRMIILASEDIGNADPYALTLAVSTYTAIEKIGMPEGRLVLSQTAIYLSQAPKSNSALKAMESAMAFVKKSPVQEVPVHLRDSHYKGAKSLGVTGYKYPHDYPGHFVDQDYMTSKMSFYKPTSEGFENEIKKRLNGRLKQYG